MLIQSTRAKRWWDSGGNVKLPSFSVALPIPCFEEEMRNEFQMNHTSGHMLDAGRETLRLSTPVQLQSLSPSLAREITDTRRSVDARFGRQCE